MNLNRAVSWQLITVALVIGVSALTPPLFAESNRSGVARWDVAVEEVDAGGVSLAPEFEVAIYENLVDELVKTRQFSRVLRTGDHALNDDPALLRLKTTVESYTPGSETKRAVTTVAGATKLKVRAQLCTGDGKVVFETVVDGNVRFFGGNLRATHNLARNVASRIKLLALPEPTPSTVESQ